MADHGCFQHESCDGTPFPARLARFFQGGGISENIYASFGDGAARSAITAWMNSTEGHRENILTGGWTHLGTGHAENGQMIFYVQDFGETRASGVPPIPAGAFEVRGDELLLLANYFDATSAAPLRFEAMLAGEAFVMEKVTGPDGNETRSVRVPRPDRCVELYFEADTAGGDTARYPDTGALLTGAGCTADFTAEPLVDPVDMTDPMVIDADDPEAGGCTQIDAPGGATSLLMILGFWVLLRRRR